MKRALVLIAGIVAATSCLIVMPVQIHADNFSIGINLGVPPPPPAIVLPAPPPLVVVPGMPVYYAPSLNVNFFAYGRRYYRHHNGSWFIASLCRPMELYRRRKGSSARPHRTGDLLQGPAWSCEERRGPTALGRPRKRREA
jgi:hypothetical protein